MRATVSTPDGPFTIIADAEHVLASGWTADDDALTALIHPQLRAGADSSHTEVLEQAKAAVLAYYDGDFAAAAAVPVRQKSGPYRELAWEVLRRVEPGHPVTYTEYARRTDKPSAVRAAAGACAQNAAALFVPCHRIIRSDGSLGGFRYGLDIKNSLLLHEGAP